MPGNLPPLGASLDQGLLKPPQLCPQRRCSDVTRTVCGRMEPNLPSRLGVSHLLLRLTSALAHQCLQEACAKNSFPHKSLPHESSSQGLLLGGTT